VSSGSSQRPGAEAGNPLREGSAGATPAGTAHASGRTVPGVDTQDEDRVGDLRLATVVVDAQDMARAVAFWSAALGYRRREAVWDPAFVMLVDPTGRGIPLSLQLADAPPREPVRLHLDLYTDEQARQVERLVRLGATRVEDWPYPDDADFVVLRDPEGNEFCVIDHVDL
jgi:catechol 2,3-dioxygenase-like lactoylglutathione lyase family enzyme